MPKFLFKKQEPEKPRRPVVKKSYALNRKIYRRAVIDAFIKLNPRSMIRNPVMFVTEVGSVLTTVIFLAKLIAPGLETPWFVGGIALWLWLCVLFANFSEALAESRGKAQAAALRQTRKETQVKLLSRAEHGAKYSMASSLDLHKGSYFLAEAGDTIAADGEVIEGVASVDESAVTGESAPVIRESGGDRSAVTGGTRVLSDWLVVRVTASPGEGFLDRMINMVEGAKRQRTPNEIALSILLAAFTIVFLVVCATLLPFSVFSHANNPGAPPPLTPTTQLTILIALLVCLIPTTIGGLLPAIGIAGMDRLIRRNVIALSGRAVEAAGDVDVLLLDKTGTITLGNRQAVAFIPVGNNSDRDVAEAAQLASLADETPEGRSIVVLAKQKFGLRASEEKPAGMHFVPFSAHTRMSGIDADNFSIRKGAADAVAAYISEHGKEPPPDLKAVTDKISLGGERLWSWLKTAKPSAWST